MGEVTPLPYEILLVDDHPLVRQGIKTIIAAQSELAVVGELQDGLDLLNCLNYRLPPPNYPGYLHAASGGN